MSTARVVIIEDEASILDSLKLLLTAAGYEVDGFPDAETFLGAEPADTGCIVSDIRLPGASGLDLQSVLNSKGSRVPIVFITGHGDIDMAVSAIKSGASDFIEKPFKIERLLNSISEAINSHPSRDAPDAPSADPDLSAAIAALSNRQRQVMRLIAGGRSNKEVAAELGISPRTVEVYRANVMSRIGAKTMADLVRIALRAGLVD